MYITEAKTVSYTMNGQESAFMVCFLAIGFLAAYNGFAKHWKLLSLSFTGLLYTRPDSPVYIAAISLAGLVFTTENRRQSCGESSGPQLWRLFSSPPGSSACGSTMASRFPTPFWPNRNLIRTTCSIRLGCDRILLSKLPLVQSPF